MTLLCSDEKTPLWHYVLVWKDSISFVSEIGNKTYRWFQTFSPVYIHYFYSWTTMKQIDDEEFCIPICYVEIRLKKLWIHVGGNVGSQRYVLFSMVFVKRLT